MALEVFTQRNFVADFIRLNFNFVHKKTTNSLFEPSFGRVRGNVRTSSIARWKAHSDSLFAIIQLFSLALTADALIRRNHLC